jgi:hypothetical protein
LKIATIWLSVNRAFFMQNLPLLNTAKQQKIPHPQCLNVGEDYRQQAEENLRKSTFPYIFRGSFATNYSPRTQTVHLP